MLQARKKVLKTSGAEKDLRSDIGANFLYDKAVDNEAPAKSEVKPQSENHFVSGQDIDNIPVF